MKTFLLLIIAATFGILPLSNAEDSLFKRFASPGEQYRPFVRWWWNGARIDTDEAIRQLDVLKQAGFGGVEINTIAMPTQADPDSFDHAPALTWLGKQWCETVERVALAARERDLVCDIIIGSGWPFGGEFLSPAEQIQRLRITKTSIQGPARETFHLEELAQAHAETADHEASYDTAPTESEYRFLRLINESESRHAFSSGVELLPAAADGRLVIDVPAGNHTLVLGIIETGYTRVKHGAPGAKGPVLDHLNRAAVSKYLEYMSTKMERHLGNDWSELFRATFVDSLELAHTNWTRDIEAEFETRRGYPLLPYLPFILDAERQDETSRRARYDFSKTIIELFDERFSQTYIEWCKANDLGSRIQAYGRETHPLHGSMSPSHPEGETWLWHDERERPRVFVDSSSINKYTASAAHLTGKRTISFEAMTNAVPVFRETLGNFKRAFDLTIQSGPNHPIMHGFNYTPPEAGFPGWVRFGCYLNERAPFWPHMRKFNDYAARIGAVLRNSDYQAQIAVLAPRFEEWERFGRLYQPFPEYVYPWYQYRLPAALQKLGFGVDFVSDEILASSTIENSKLVYNGRAYEALILEDVNAVSTAAARVLEEFSNKNGKLAFLGNRPKRTSGLTPSWQANSQNVESSLTSLQNQNTITIPAPLEPDHHPNPTEPGKRGMPFDDSSLIRYLENLTHRLDLKPLARLTTPSPTVSLTHHKADDQRDIVFLSNSSNSEYASVELETSDLEPYGEIWSPKTVSREPIVSDANNRVRFNLPPSGSLLIVFSDSPSIQQAAATNTPDRSTTLDLTRDWELAFKPILNQEPFTTTVQSLVDISLSADPKIANFAGSITYKKRIHLPAPVENATLDLGFINGTSLLRIDGQTIDTTWYGNHEYDLPKLTESPHDFEIEVTTTLGNYVRSLKTNKTAQRWASWFRPIETGIIGPISIRY